MKIIQIISEDRIIYGLGDNNHVYRWDYSGSGWVEHWDTRTGDERAEARQAVAHQFNPNRNRTNPGM